MAQANVSSTYGRESNSVYNETLNGVRGNTPAHQFALECGSLPNAGRSYSGLLPHIQSGDGGVPGSGDLSIQAYNFRLCLTKTETNRLPITAPTNYDAGEYELLGRYVQARVTAGHSFVTGFFSEDRPDAEQQDGYQQQRRVLD